MLKPNLRLLGEFSKGVLVIAVSMAWVVPSANADSGHDIIKGQFKNQFETIGSGYILSRAEVIGESEFHSLVNKEMKAWALFRDQQHDGTFSPEEEKKIARVLQKLSDEIYDQSRTAADYHRRVKVMKEHIEDGVNLQQITSAELQILNTMVADLESMIERTAKDLILSGRERMRIEQSVIDLSQKITELEKNSDGVPKPSDAKAELAHNRSVDLAGRTVSCLARGHASVAQIEPFVKNQRDIRDFLVAELKKGSLGLGAYTRVISQLATNAEELDELCSGK